MVQVQLACNVSQRRACKTLGQPRSTQRYQATQREDDQRLLDRILELVREFPRYGYRMITRLLRQEGWQVNFKRIYRIWKREGLKVPIKKVKKRRLGDRSGGIRRRRAGTSQPRLVSRFYLRPNRQWPLGEGSIVDR